MTKRIDLIAKIRRSAARSHIKFVRVRQGSCHEIWMLGSTRVAIPRHRELKEPLVVSIYRLCESELGNGWWK